MNLRNAIIAEHSKRQADKIVKWVGNSQERFDELMSLFLGTEYKLVQHAAWPVSYCVINHPGLVEKHFRELVARLKDKNTHPAVKRNITRLLPHVSIPKRYHGAIMDSCIRFLTTPDEKAAVKAFSLAVLENMAKEYPDISGEVELIINDQWDREPASFRSRAKKFLASTKASQ